MGRQRTPSHLRLVSGTRDTTRTKKQAAREPIPRGNLAEPPDWFNEEQAKVWRQVLADAPPGLLRRLDGGLLATWCVASQLHAKYSKLLNDGPSLVKSKEGVPQQSPYLSMLNRQVTLMKSIAAEMGFSPAARTRISVEEGDPQGDPTDHYFD